MSNDLSSQEKVTMSPADTLRRLINSQVISRLIYVVAKLGIADFIKIVYKENNMNLKIIFNVIVVSFFAGFFSSCRFTEIIFYEHQPSKVFYETYNINDKNLIDFIDDDILFVIDIKKVNHQGYVLWLGLYSSVEGKEMKIEKIIIQNKDWSQELTINKLVKLHKSTTHADLLNSNLKLFQLKRDVLEKAFYNSAELTLRVLYLTEHGEATKYFNLKRRVEKHTVFPT